MSTNALGPAAAKPAEALAALAGELLRRERRLAIGGFAILALLGPSLVALLIDGRTLNGIPIWVKPMKFQASVGIYLLTLAWFFGALPERVRAGRAVGILVAGALAASVFEIGYITLQAGLGSASHYNTDDPFHAAMYTAMGIGAVTLTAISPALGILLLRHRPAHWPLAFWFSVLIGLFLTFVLGAGAGIVLGSGDGHWIGGVRSDAGGIPLLGWSRTGGDLRVAHFLGMHALQVLPVIGFTAARLLSARTATLAVAVGATAYCAATAFVFAQALRGIPLLSLA